jgi:hypothetical protein
VLRIAIVVLSLLDGILHLALNQILFRGNFFGPLPFQSPFFLPMNLLFVLNFVGYVILAAVFWYAPRYMGGRRWLVDAVLMIYTLLSIGGWLQIGSPNPQGLGYLSKVLEVGLLVALGVHGWRVAREESGAHSTA